MDPVPGKVGEIRRHFKFTKDQQRAAYRKIIAEFNGIQGSYHERAQLASTGPFKEKFINHEQLLAALFVDAVTQWVDCRTRINLPFTAVSDIFCR